MTGSNENEVQEYAMLDRIDIQRIVAATIGGLILSAACLVSAAAPARATTPSCNCGVVFLAK